MNDKQRCHASFFVLGFEVQFQNCREGLSILLLSSPFLLTFGELPKLFKSCLMHCFPTGADLRPELSDHCAVRFGWLLAAAGPSFPGAATAALDASPVRPCVGRSTGSRPWLPVHWRHSERLGPGERDGRQGMEDHPGLDLAPGLVKHK